MPLEGSSRPVLVTGTAGFIGMHVCRRLLRARRQPRQFDAVTRRLDAPRPVQAQLSRLLRVYHVGNHRPDTPLEAGLSEFAAWFRPYHKM